MFTYSKAYSKAFGRLARRPRLCLVCGTDYRNEHRYKRMLCTEHSFLVVLVSNCAAPLTVVISCGDTLYRRTIRARTIAEYRGPGGQLEMSALYSKGHFTSAGVQTRRTLRLSIERPILRPSGTLHGARAYA